MLNHLLPSPSAFPKPLPAGPIQAAAIAIAVNIYRAIPADSEPGKCKVLGSFLRQRGEESRGMAVPGAQAAPTAERTNG